jgi:hypothetical protein
MSNAVYTVSQTSRGWIVRHEGEASQPYETAGTAFEAACIAASLRIEQGSDATVSIEYARRADDGFGYQANVAAYIHSQDKQIQ